MIHRILLCVCALIALPAFAQESKTLQDFETSADLRLWEFKQKSASLSPEHATHGSKSLKISSTEYMTSLGGVFLISVTAFLATCRG